MTGDGETMGASDFINIFIYSDSLAFRRPGQPEDISFTYPFLLKSFVEERLGKSANVLLRGSGGADAKYIRQMIKRDAGYFRGAKTPGRNYAILQFGVVDCAPRPITYMFTPVLRRLPLIGTTVMEILVKHRATLQKIWSYRITSPGRFEREYRSVLGICRSMELEPIVVGIPLPPLGIEKRSPGFRKSVAIYNRCIEGIFSDSYCNIEEGLSDDVRDSILLPDGHHLTEEGHRYYAEMMFARLQRGI